MYEIYRRVFIALTLIASDSVFAEGTVQWSNLSASGNGCPAGSAVITSTPDGNELAWTADSFGYELSGESSASRFCRMNAAAVITPGYYLDEISQQISYGGFKSKNGSELTVGAQARFLGFNLQPLTREYADGTAFNWKKTTFRRNQKFSVVAPAEYFCGEETRSGLFQGTVASNALISTPEGKVSLGIQGMTVSYKARFKWLPCPI